MDPNQFNYQQSMFNFMQNFQNPNPQNSQFPSMPTNSAAFFRHQPETLCRIFSVTKLHHMVNHLWNFFVMNRKHRLCLCPKVKFHHFQLKSVLKKKKVALLKKSSRGIFKGWRYTSYPIMTQCFKGFNCGSWSKSWEFLVKNHYQL